MDSLPHLVDELVETELLNAGCASVVVWEPIRKLARDVVKVKQERDTLLRLASQLVEDGTVAAFNDLAEYVDSLGAVG